MKQGDNALKQFLKSKMECEKRNFNKLRNRVINKTRKAKANFYISIIEKGKGNTKLIWENLKNLTGKCKKKKK